tara:strand:- start:299 stop:4276 length:3978 start_codon:yes stop_codon:yes gene_type:complete
MGACGDGVEPSGGSGGAGDGQKKPEKPKSLGAFDFVGDILGAIGGELQDAAIGTLATALIGDPAFGVTFKKNRPSTDENIADLQKQMSDLDTPQRTSARGDVGDKQDLLNLKGDLQAKIDILKNNPYDSGVDPEGPLNLDNVDDLPQPADFLGQQAIIDGDLYVWKDPPGTWINFGNQDTKFDTTDQDRQVPIYSKYTAEILEVHNQDSITTNKTWSDGATESGHIGPTQVNLETKFDTWYVDTPVTQDLHTYMKFDEEGSALIINQKEDVETYVDFPNSIVYKLYEPLPDNVEKNDLIYICKQMSSPLLESVELVDFIDEEIEDVVLRNPKWDAGFHSDGGINQAETNYKTYNELVTSNKTIQELIEDKVISGSLDESITLDGIDHSQFENFAKFSSVEDRVVNFKYKLDKIELFTSQSNSLNGVLGVETAEYTQSLLNNVREIKNNFTPFEKYMYFESSSYSSGSLGVFNDNAWPKKSGAGTNLDPYVLYSVSESVASSWYTRQIISSSNYDRENRNRLLLNIPAHIRDDERNDAFTTFINMTGEHFDGIWQYINQIPAIYDRRDGLDVGLSRDLIFQVGRSFGFYLNDGQDLVSLPNYLIGADVTGSSAEYSVQSATPQKDISREIWKRILNNMPFFLKTRGTIRSIKGLISCYGIPSSILRVREFGGPNPNKNKPSYQITRKFTSALELKSGQHIQTTWANDTKSSRKPDTIEMRFRAASGSNQTLWQAGTDIALRLVDNGSADNYGTVQFFLEGGANPDFTLSSTSLPIYDGEFYSVMLTRMSASIGDSGRHYSGSSAGQLTTDTTSQNILYSLHVGRYDSGVQRTIYKSWTSGSTSTTSVNSAYVGNETAYIGGKPSNDFGNQLSGSIMEFRYWNTALNSGSFDNHVGAPKAFDGNHASASWEDLVLRYSFDDDKNLDSSTSIRDTSADQSYTAEGTATGYTSGNRPHFRNLVDQQKAKVPNLGPNVRVENKIRIEQSKLLGGLSVDKRSEISAYDLAPLDSNRLGVYFSPSDAINEDIILSVADLDYDDFIGDPRDKYKRRYRQLEDIATTYWQKYNTPNDFWDYIRLIRFYDTSVFDQIRKMIPAKARANVGLLIEPNLLERRKEVIGAPPTKEPINVRGNLDVGFGRVVSGSTKPMSASIDLDAQLSQSGMYLTYSGSLSVAPSASGNYNTYTGSISTDIFRKPALYILSSSLSGWGGGEEKYGHFKLEVGGPEHIFSEVLQPNISGSRISEHNYERRFFYTTQASASENNFYSSSLVRSDKQSLYQDNQMFRLVYKGSLQTKRTTLDKADPVTVVLTSPTTLITKETGESKLEVL